MQASRSGITFAWQQQLGARTLDQVQQDRVRIDQVRTASGGSSLLAVVADGEDHPQAGQAAEAVIAWIFESVHDASGSRWIQNLEKAIEGSQAVAAAHGARVAVTVTLVHRKRLYWAHVGHSMALLVREAQARLLTPSHPSLLGDSEPPRIDLGPDGGIAIQSDDRVILATDALMRIRPEIGKPYLDLVEIAEDVQESNALEAARHLVSVAMGRDINDNITVAVLHKAPLRRSGPAARMLLGGLALAAVFVAGFLLRPILTHSNPAQGSEMGYAIIIEGQARSISAGQEKSLGKLDTISPPASIQAMGDLRLGLHSTSEIAVDLTSVSLYLSDGGLLDIMTIDVQDDEGVGLQESTMSLSQGWVLLLRRGGGRRFVFEGMRGSTALEGTGLGALGLQREGEFLQVDCIQGTCWAEDDDGGMVYLASGQRIQISAGEMSSAYRILSNDRVRWDEQCGGCLVGGEN